MKKFLMILAATIGLGPMKSSAEESSQLANQYGHLVEQNQMLRNLILKSQKATSNNLSFEEKELLLDILNRAESKDMTSSHESEIGQ